MKSRIVVSGVRLVTNLHPDHQRPSKTSVTVMLQIYRQAYVYVHVLLLSQQKGNKDFFQHLLLFFILNHMVYQLMQKSANSITLIASLNFDHEERTYKISRHLLSQVHLDEVAPMSPSGRHTIKK